MSDCLRTFLLHEIPFYGLFLCIARFAGGIIGWEFWVLFGVAAVCVALEYPIFKRCYWKGDKK